MLLLLLAVTLLPLRCCCCGRRVRRRASHALLTAAATRAPLLGHCGAARAPARVVCVAVVSGHLGALAGSLRGGACAGARRVRCCRQRPPGRPCWVFAGQRPKCREWHARVWGGMQVVARVCGAMCGKHGRCP
eukprot:364943-Chlamydomonas_euryale.AAC.1